MLTETDEIRVYKRLVFLMLLYGGATLAEAADDVGVSGETASNRLSAGMRVEWEN